MEEFALVFPFDTTPGVGRMVISTEGPSVASTRGASDTRTLPLLRELIACREVDEYLTQGATVALLWTTTLSPGTSTVERQTKKQKKKNPSPRMSREGRGKLLDHLLASPGSRLASTLPEKRSSRRREVVDKRNRCLRSVWIGGAATSPWSPFSGPGAS